MIAKTKSALSSAEDCADVKADLSFAFCVYNVYVCLFVLRFYGPVNPMGSCRARSVYLTTCLLGRLSPLSG